MPKWVRWVVVGGLVLVAAAVVSLRLVEDRLLFHPSAADSRETRDAYAAVAAGRVRAAVEDVWLTADDGVRLHAWWMSPRAGASGPLPVVLWFHGNGGNIGRWLSSYVAVVALGAQVLAVDYRGYGRSEGSPSEEGLYRDADAAWSYLTGERGIAPARIFVYGYSLGGGVAVDLASRVRAAGLIVQSSFPSIPEAARALMPYVPSFLVRAQMDSLSKIAGVGCPTLFMHGTADRLVPLALGQRLYEAALPPKQFFTVEGASHNRAFAQGGPRWLETLRLFLHPSDAPR